MELSCPFEFCEPVVGYACGEYFIWCASKDDLDCVCNCPSCFHSSEELTVTEWNNYANSLNKKTFEDNGKESD